jgi:GNAT superfamily N-acetyltransferase
MQLRDATETDLAACLPLLRQLWADAPAPIQTPRHEAELKAVFRRLLRAPDARVILAWESEQAVALMDLTVRDTLFHCGATMVIEDLIVDAAHRRRGIGKRLVELAEEIARERGCRGVELSSDLFREETHEFWQALGYEAKASQFRKTLGD